VIFPIKSYVTGYCSEGRFEEFRRPEGLFVALLDPPQLPLLDTVRARAYRVSHSLLRKWRFM
jgi:hypothetical protein